MAWNGRRVNEIDSAATQPLFNGVHPLSNGFKPLFNGVLRSGVPEASIVFLNIISCPEGIKALTERYAQPSTQCLPCPAASLVLVLRGSCLPCLAWMATAQTHGHITAKGATGGSFERTIKGFLYPRWRARGQHTFATSAMQTLRPRVIDV